MSFVRLSATATVMPAATPRTLATIGSVEAAVMMMSVASASTAKPQHCVMREPKRLKVRIALKTVAGSRSRTCTPAASANY